MEDQSFGEHVVSIASSDRQWWQLSMAEVQQRARALGWPGDPMRGPWTGLDWDEYGVVRICEREITREQVMQLVTEIGRLISERGVDVARLPDMNSVRRGMAIREDNDDGWEEGLTPLFEVETEVLVVDVEFDEFIAPVGSHLGTLDPGASISGKASSIICEATSVREVRREIAPREVRMRDALESAATASGGTLVPLWLRGVPWDPLVYDGRDLPYDVITFGLDKNLLWELCEYRISWDEELEISDQEMESLHRRGMAKAVIDRTGYGLVCDVARALMDEYAMDPRIVFKILRKSQLSGRPASLEVGRGDISEKFVLCDGFVELVIKFAGGRYSSGSLELYGQYPTIIETSAKGQPLADLVEHPAFQRSGVVVNECRSSGEALELLHEFRAVPITQDMVQLGE